MDGSILPPPAAPADAQPAATPPCNLNSLIATFAAQIAALDAHDAAAAHMLAAAMVASDLPGAHLAPLLKEAASRVKADPTVAVREGMRARAALKSSRAPAPEADTGPSPYLMPDYQASSNPNSLAWVLDQIVRVISRRVVVSKEAMWAVALWMACTWGVRQHGQLGGPSIFPRLLIFAPTKRAGKSTLLETVMSLSRAPIMASNITVAALFRTISAFFPTLGLDEADNSLRNNRELVGVTNSGHARNGSVLRTVETQTRSAAGGSKKDFEPRAFSTFAPMVIAGIGQQAGTTADRSIRVQLQRQPASALQDPMDYDRLAELRERLAPELAAHGEAMAHAMAAGLPALHFLPSIGSRDRDNWRPLIRVAELAGEAWPARVQSALVALCQDAEDRRSASEQLLSDIRHYARGPRTAAMRRLISRWNDARAASGQPLHPLTAEAAHPLAIGAPPSHPRSNRPCDFILSADLAAWLMEKDDSPLAKERDVGAAKLRIATMLRGFGIQPGQRAAGRGYQLQSLRKAWRRYL